MWNLNQVLTMGILQSSFVPSSSQEVSSLSLCYLVLELCSQALMEARGRMGGRSWKETVRKIRSRISRSSGSGFEFQGGEEERQTGLRRNRWKEA